SFTGGSQVLPHRRQRTHISPLIIWCLMTAYCMLLPPVLSTDILRAETTPPFLWVQAFWRASSVAFCCAKVRPEDSRSICCCNRVFSRLSIVPVFSLILRLRSRFDNSRSSS